VGTRVQVDGAPISRVTALNRLGGRGILSGMSYEIIVKEVDAQPIVSIRTKCHAAVIGSTLAEILPEVFRYLRENGVWPSGPPFTRYHGFDETEVDIEGGMPVSSPLVGTGRIAVGELPGGKVATTIHTGPYEKLPEAHDALHTWMREQNVESAGAQWECYVTDPGEEPNPYKRRTELVWPIK
jgi:effector-binding domain-containing protein